MTYKSVYTLQDNNDLKLKRQCIFSQGCVLDLADSSAVDLGLKRVMLTHLTILGTLSVYRISYPSYKFLKIQTHTKLPKFPILFDHVCGENSKSFPM